MSRPWWVLVMTLASVACASGATRAPSKGPSAQATEASTVAREAFAHAELSALPAAERHTLEALGAVTLPLDYDDEDRPYVGGFGYQLVPGTVDEVYAKLRDVDGLRKVLPRTFRAQLVGEASHGYRVELEQGTSWVRVVYTVTMHEAATAEGAREVRFWLDPERPHEIEDVWGFFRVEPFDNSRCLVTTGAVVDLGSDVLHFLFAPAVERAILATPHRVFRYVVEESTDPERKSFAAEAGFSRNGP